MDNEIVLEDVEVVGKKVEYIYKVIGEVRSYFSTKCLFELEYSEEVSGVPKGVLVIPFLCNVLPIVWLNNCIIRINCEVDDKFYKCIDEIREGYKTMYPNLTFKGEIIANKIVNIHPIQKNNERKSACLFSGGLDATTTLFRHIDENPDLITIWGSDIGLDDVNGWNAVTDHIMSTAQLNSLEMRWVRSNFRSFILCEHLDQLVNKRVVNGTWWHEIQHGIGIIGHVAPFAYLHGYFNLYIASSFNEKQKGLYTCASDPLIDNKVSFIQCQVYHDGYELTRQDKARFVVNQAQRRKRSIKLRVCYEEAAGKNCCKCEKCYRTILEIASEGGDPNSFGFVWDKKAIHRCKNDFYNKIVLPDWNVENFLKPIQRAFKANEDKYLDDYKWYIKLDLDRFNEYPIKKIRKALSYFKHSILHL